MANITLKITVRRMEGRNPVDPSEIAAILAAAVEELGEFEVDDTEGEAATYEVTRVAVVTEQLPLVGGAPIDFNQCGWCGEVLVRSFGGRPRLYCNEAHRQAAYRERHGTA